MKKSGNHATKINRQMTDWRKKSEKLKRQAKKSFKFVRNYIITNSGKFSATDRQEIGQIIGLLYFLVKILNKNIGNNLDEIEKSAQMFIAEMDCFANTILSIDNSDDDATANESSSQDESESDSEISERNF